MTVRSSLLSLLAGSLAVAGCAHHQTAPASQPIEPTPAAEAAPVVAPPAPVAVAPEPAATPALDATRVYFDLDQSLLSSQGEQILQQLWQALSAHQGAKLKIAGNCDERGTEEYNLALGQARADAAKRYLVELGASSTRISTVSYGKDRPVAEGHDESAWSQNRRDDLEPLK